MIGEYIEYIIEIVCLRGVKRSVMNRAIIFFQSLYKKIFLGNGEHSNIRSPRALSYELLWID